MLDVDAADDQIKTNNYLKIQNFKTWNASLEWFFEERKYFQMMHNVQKFNWSFFVGQKMEIHRDQLVDFGPHFHKIGKIFTQEH